MVGRGEGSRVFEGVGAMEGRRKRREEAATAEMAEESGRKNHEARIGSVGFSRFSLVAALFSFVGVRFLSWLTVLSFAHGAEMGCPPTA